MNKNSSLIIRFKILLRLSRYEKFSGTSGNRSLMFYQMLQLKADRFSEAYRKLLTIIYTMLARGMP